MMSSTTHYHESTHNTDEINNILGIHKRDQPSIFDKPAAIDNQYHPIQPFNLNEWIRDNKHLLQPPVGNKLLYGENCQFKVMIVGGPNTRTDYHVEEGEEWFYMIEGSMVLKIVDNGIFKDIVIHQGESYLLPPNIPHSPQRPANTIGLVIEREREPNWTDALQWYCMKCHHTTTQHKFHCHDLGVELVPLIKSYYSDESQRTCKYCGTVDQPPTSADAQHIIDIIELSKQKPVNEQKDMIDDQTQLQQHQDSSAIDNSTHPVPFNVGQWISSHASQLQPPVGNAMMYGRNAQFKIMIVGGPNQRNDYHIEAGEEWFWQLKGDMILKVNDNGTLKDINIKEGECFLLPAYVPHSPQRQANTIGIVVERERNHDEIDGLRWYCQQCHNILYTYSFYCYDLGVQLKPVIQHFYGDTMLSARTCKQCGHVETKPTTSQTKNTEYHLE